MKIFFAHKILCLTIFLTQLFLTIMRILHTSDLHIGKKLEFRSRLDEQKDVLDEIVSVADENDVQLVLIAGDVYDTFTPSSEAEKLFYEFLSNLSAGKRIVVVVSGNHDDAMRLSASRTLSACSDVYFADGENVIKNGDFLSSGIKMREVGSNYFVVESTDGEKAYIGTLSYPTELRLKEKISSEETYEEKVRRWIGACFENNREKLPQILVSHLFMLGGVKTDGERSIELGGARIVSKSAIPDECVYTALGHLHKRQVVDRDRNVIYSGSILQYSFDEAKTDKSVTVFDLSNGTVQNLNVVKLSAGIKLFRLSASSLSEAREMLGNVDGFVELTLKLDKPLEYAEHKAFLQEFPNVFPRLSFNGGESFSGERRSLSDKEVFVEFYKSKYGEEPDVRLTDAFMEIINAIEVGDETA